MAYAAKLPDQLDAASLPLQPIDSLIVGQGVGEDSRAKKAPIATVLAAVSAGNSYVWSTSTSAADPGLGKIAINHGTAASATAVYISELDALGTLMASEIATWATGTSTVRGKLKITKTSDATTFIRANVTGSITDGGAWDTLTISYVDGGGAFANGDAVTVLFIPKGDKGDASAVPGISGTSAATRVRVVSTTNVAIATALENGDTLNGVVLATNDLVLLTGQTAPAENGVYVTPASGAASRHSDFSTYDSLPGTLFSVMEGTAKADTLWQVTSNRGGTLGVTAIVITEFVSGVPATTSAAGIVELATSAETVTGTDTDRAVVPAGLTARLAAPGAIGGSTPAAGSFTTLSVTGGQVTFPAAQNPSANANTLDDYEEGTWTPAIQFGGAAVGVTYSLQSGQYTKIGNVVNYAEIVILTSKGSSTGSATVAGLPFTASAFNGVAGSVQANNLAAAVATTLQGVVAASSTTIGLSRFAAGVNTTMADTDFANNSILRVSGTYFV